MAIKGKYPYYIVDTIAERDSLTDVDFPERLECLVTNSADTPPLPQLYKYDGSSWIIVGGAAIDQLVTSLTGQAGKFPKVNATEDGYDFVAGGGGGGDMIGANNLSDVANPATALSNIGGQPLDTDLSALAGLNSATAGVPASIGAGWIHRTYAQLKTLLVLVAGDVGLGSVVNLDTSTTANITDSTNKRFVTDANNTKLGFISVTQPVDLDDIEARVNNLDAAVVLNGTWDASAGTFPGGGTAQAGASYIVSVGGTVDGVVFAVNDRVIAIADNASTTSAADWFKADYTDQVLSVNGLTGAVTLTTANVADSANKRYVTDAHLTILGNTSGTNSGNETTASLGTTISGAVDATTPANGDFFALCDAAASFIVRRLSWLQLKTELKNYFDTIYQAVLVAGTNIKNINGSSILGSGNLTVSATITEVEVDVGATPVISASIPVTDAAITPTSKMLGGIAYKAPTGKDLDELEMDNIDIKFEPGTGTFNVHLTGNDGYIADKFIIWYQAAA